MNAPLLFYGDDTSGNVSKQWNKHISIFMPLAELPQKLSNQEFDKLFVATSNTASALELAAPDQPDLHCWTATRNKSYHTWELVKQRASKNQIQWSFDGHKDTPVEVFHVVLLGIIEYLYCDIIRGLSGNKKEDFIERLQSFDTGNLNI
ncbi:hypothetical protein BY996DRAFT_8528209 [Phakopsora pachyrhizi]|nr:hypothetical protein BY996DRAFT_8528209 [Phakopsora pachyrhizi]